MALFTTVDEGYDVQTFTSFDSLWLSVSQCHLRTDNDSPLWLDKDESISLTKTGLRKELREQGCARIFEDGQGDWTIKVQKH